MLVGDLIFDQITDSNLHSGLEFFVLLHFLVDEVDGLGRDVAAVVVEALELSEKWKESVADSAAEFVVVAGVACELMVQFEVCDFWHFSFEVGAVFEEIALVELVELVPNLLPALCHAEIVLLGDHSSIFGQG